MPVNKYYTSVFRKVIGCTYTNLHYKMQLELNMFFFISFLQGIKIYSFEKFLRKFSTRCKHLCTFSFWQYGLKPKEFRNYFFWPWFYSLCRDENHWSKLWGFFNFGFVLKGGFSCDNHKNYQRRRIYVESLSLKVKHDCRNLLNWSFSLCTLDGHWRENLNFLTFC